MENASTILDILKEALPDLSSAQRNLAEFILKSPAEAAFLSSYDLAEQANASPSTAVRLARLVGYEGFPEFQAALQQLVIEHLKTTTRLYSTLNKHGERDKLVDCLKADITALEKAIQAISPDVFAATVNALSCAGRIYLVGLGISQAVAMALAFRLRRLRLDVHAVTQGGSDALEPLLAMQAGDVLVAIAFRRVRSEILAAMDFARSRGAVLVAMAESSFSSHALKADHVLLTQRGPTETLNSLAVPMAVVNALSLAVSKKRERDALLAYSWVGAFEDVFLPASQLQFDDPDSTKEVTRDKEED